MDTRLPQNVSQQANPSPRTNNPPSKPTIEELLKELNIKIKLFENIAYYATKTPHYWNGQEWTDFPKTYTHKQDLINELLQYLANQV